MLHLHHITSLDAIELEPYRTLRQTTEHWQQGIFVAEGEKVVARLVESTLRVQSFLMTPEWFEIYRSRLEARTDAMQVFLGDKNLLNAIVGFHLHQGIMAVAKTPDPPDMAAIVQAAQKPLLFVAVDGITNSENLGVLVRNCAAFGVQALIAGEHSSSPYLRRAVRNSMGTVFQLPVIHSERLVQTLRDLRSRFSIHVVAAHPHTEDRFVASVDFRRDTCVVFGSEGTGISADVLMECSESAAIPMAEGVDSLNVSNASAVFLYEIARQRGGKLV